MARISQRKPTHLTPHQIQSILFFDPFPFLRKKPTSPNKINKIMGVCPRLRLNHLGLPNGAAGAFPAVHQTAALLFLHLGGWEWRVQFLPKCLGGQKQKTIIFQPLFFFLRDFFLGEDPEFLGFALYSAPFLFGWMGKTCSETRADTTIRTCMIPKILLANLGNLKYKINVEEPWFCNTSKDGTSLSGNKLAVVT